MQICDNVLMFNVYICKTLINHRRYTVRSKKVNPAHIFDVIFETP